MFKAKIKVTLKKSVSDPQGQTVLHALHTLGYQETQDVRIGKYFEVTVDSKDQPEAEKRIRGMCDQLLMNPVIEDYSVEVLKS